MNKRIKIWVVIIISIILLIVLFCVAKISKIQNLQDEIQSEVQPNIQQERIDTISTIFPSSHEEQAHLIEVIDLDGDQIKERISLTSLHYNGGDGGYQIAVFRVDEGQEVEIPLPEDYQIETGFSFSTKWNKEGVELFSHNKLIKQLTYEEIDRLESTREEVITGDAVSGFTVLTDKNGKPELILKSYLSGTEGHADCFGYAITKLRLNPNNSWEMEHEFLLDEE